MPTSTFIMDFTGTESPKVILSIPCLLRGGTEMQTLALSRSLTESGKEVSVICYHEFSDEVVKSFEQSGARVHLLKWQRGMNPFIFIFKLAKIFRREHARVVHVQYMAPGALPIVAAKLAGTNMIFATVHQTAAAYKFRHRLLVRLSSRLCTKFTCVSEAAERSWFGNSAIFDPDDQASTGRRHVTIHNSIDTGRIGDLVHTAVRSTLLSEYGFEGRIVIGTISRLRHEKGIDVLADAFARIAVSDPRLRLLVIGDGPDKGILEEQCNRLGVSGKVCFAGELPWEQAISRLSIIDIFVSPSRFEGFGLSAAEAMAAGKAVVATRTGGFEELITDLSTGLLFNPGDTGDLAEKITSLINDPGLASRIGEQARREIESRFSWDHFGKQINSLYSIL